MSEPFFKITNFKKFDSKILPLGKNVFINGKIRSGKTQLLWAYAIFLRSYNSKKDIFNFSNDFHNTFDQNLGSDNPNQNSYSSDFESLIKNCPKQNLNTPYCEFSGIVDQKLFEFKLFSNCFIKISTIYEKNRIEFVYVNNFCIFSKKNCKYFTFSSIDQGQRIRYHLLDNIDKGSILKFMKKLFNITKIKQKKDYSIMLYEIDNESHEFQMEIMYQSSCVQKIFSSLILFYTLKNFKSEEKYYIIDSPECNLDNFLLKKILDKIFKLSKKNNIKIIMASSLSELCSYYNEDEIISL